MKAQIFEHSVWLHISSPQEIKETFSHILNQCGFTILNFTDHHFQPIGYTALWLLSESHLAVHTFPEENKYYVQLSSCSKEIYESFIELTNQLL